ncbi:oligosaccharide flippase family protein [Pelagibius sp.]|uniref:oligosaccharide flippase family protein n=1 Tax=Pelagibius sp. TaxID=1931238 RepID=UPI003B51357F
MARAQILITQTAWASAGQIVQVVAGLVSLIVLVRILGAETYGVFALGLLFTMLADVFVGGHAADGVVQKESLSEAEKSGIYAALMAVGLACAAALVAAGSLAATFFDTPGLAEILPVMALLPVLTAAASVPNQLLVRQLRFSTLAKVNAVASVLAVSFGIALAFAGYGIWSLIGLELLRRFIILILIHVALRWIPKARFSTGDLVVMGRFGLRRIENRVLSYISVQALPRGIIGYVLGTEALGFFVVARRFIDQLNAVLSGPMSAVALPATAQLRSEPEKIESLIASLIRVGTWTFWPALLGALVTAPLLLPLVFGRDWADTAVVMQVLILASLRTPLSGFAPNVLTAYGALGDISRARLIAIAVGAVTCGIGAQFGLLGAVAGLALRQWLLAPVLAGFVARHSGVAVRRQLGVLAHAAVPAVAMAVMVAALGWVLGDRLAPSAELSALVVAGLFLYPPLWLAWNAQARPSALAALGGLLRGDRAAATRSLKAVIAPGPG